METLPQTTEQPSLLPATFDYMPKDLEQAIRLSELLAKSTMVPKDYIDKPGNVFLAMQHGAELGLKPSQAIQSIAVIGNRPGIFGDAGKALLLRHGCRITEMDTAAIQAEQRATCTIARPGFADVTRTFSVEDAKRANLWTKDGPWKLYPYRQLQWRAFWWAARDQCPDILKGVQGIEELRDIAPRDVTSESTVEREPAPNGNTRTNSLKERLKIVNVNEVLDAFAKAQDAEQLAAAVQKATGLKAEDHREQANNAYHAAKTRIREASQPAGPTDDEIVAKLAAAKTEDDIALVMDLVRPVKETEPERYGLLMKLCTDQRKKLAEPA